EAAVLKDHPGPVTAVAFAPDGKTLAAATGSFTIDTGRWNSGEVKLWDPAARQERGTLRRHADMIASLAFAPDSQTLITASWDSSLKVWDVGMRQERMSLSGHSNHVNCVALSPDGKVMASASGDRTARLWQLVWVKGK